MVCHIFHLFENKELKVFCHFLNHKVSAIFSFPILKNGKSRLFLLRVSNSKVLNEERIIEFHCESGVLVPMNVAFACKNSQ